MADQRIRHYLNEVDIVMEMFDEIGRNFPAIWHPEDENFHMRKLKREMFGVILNRLEMRFPGRIPCFVDADLLQNVWQAEKNKYINLWRDGRPQDSIYAGNLRYLNTVATPQPSNHPWIEWRERRRIEGHLIQQRREIVRLNQQLTVALQGQLQAQNMVNAYVRELVAYVRQLGQANANVILMRHQIEML